MRTTFLPIELTIQHRGKPLTLRLWEDVEYAYPADAVMEVGGGEFFINESADKVKIQCLEAEIVGPVPDDCNAGDDLYLIDSPELHGHFRVKQVGKNRIGAYMRSNGVYSLVLLEKA